MNTQLEVIYSSVYTVYATLDFHISHICTCSDIAHSQNVCSSAGCVDPNAETVCH